MTKRIALYLNYSIHNPVGMSLAMIAIHVYIRSSDQEMNTFLVDIRNKILKFHPEIITSTELITMSHIGK